MKFSALALVILIAGSSCTFIFGEIEETQLVEICEGRGRVFDLGQELTPGKRFEHVDFRQGTLTFWAESLEPVEAFDVLVSLGGIAIVALEDEILLQYFKTTDPSTRVVHEISLPFDDWEPGVDHFFSMRWDSVHSLSGYGSTETHLELRLDGEVVFSGEPSQFEWIPDAAEDLFFGTGGGMFHVDQVVIYDRPLYVNTDTQDPSVLDEMYDGGDKGAGPVLAEGGLDVLLATVSPKEAGCGDAFTAEAWTLPAGAAELGYMKVVTTGTPFSLALEVADQIYPGGGTLLLDATSEQLSVPVTQNASYTLDLLSHGIGADQGRPVVTVILQEAGVEDRVVLTHEAEVGSRVDPTRSLLSFQVGPAETTAVIRVEALAGSIALHHMALYPNLYQQPAFEALQGEQTDPWRRETSEDAVVFDSAGAYAGMASVCVDDEIAQGVLLQEPGGTTNANQLRDDRIYLFGAQMLWRGRDQPSVNIGNGSFFATGLPYDRRRKSHRSVSRMGEWQSVGTVGRRLQNGLLNNHNDLVRYGSGHNAEGTDFCMDSSYAMQAQTVEGLTLLPTARK